MLAINDHIILILVALAQPVLGYRSFHRLLRLAAAGRMVKLGHLYNRTIIGQWLLFALLLITWYSNDRPWAALGFTLRWDWPAAAGAALAIAVLLTLIVRLRRLAGTDEETREALLARLGHVEIILPRTAAQLRHFYAVSITAGIVEESIWRGFMLWYLGHFMPLWAAVILSSLSFGLAHIYQGVANVPKSAVIGFVFATIYVLTGSLLIPILLHALADALQGRAVFRLLCAATGPGPARAPAPR